MLIRMENVFMSELGGGVVAMENGKCPLGTPRHCCEFQAESGKAVRTCDFFDPGEPANNELQCTYGIDFRPLP
jgi:hypothetical protein